MGDEQSREKWFRQLKKSTEESSKSWWTTLLLSFIALDTIYLGDVLLGVVKFFTFGGFLLWLAYDLVMLLIGRRRDADGKRVRPPYL